MLVGGVHDAMQSNREAVSHLVVMDGAVSGGVLQQHARHILVEGEAGLVADHHLEAQSICARLAHRDSLRVALVLRATKAMST